jgi:hypothetical protein
MLSRYYPDYLRDASQDTVVFHLLMTEIQTS